MSLIDKHFKDALRELPEKKLSWQADRRIKKSIRKMAARLDGHFPFWMSLRRLVAVPMALAVLFTATTGYAYYSPGVVQGDLLFPIKTALENQFYPDAGSSEERVAYHLWLSERRYAEAREILSRRGGSGTALVPAAYAQDDGDLLGEALLHTLQKATQHVEYAFLVTAEIREIDRVQQVKEQIRESMRKQKAFVEEVTPVLQEVKLQQKTKARIKKSVPAQATLPPEASSFPEAVSAQEDGERVIEVPEDVQPAPVAEVEAPAVGEEPLLEDPSVELRELMPEVSPDTFAEQDLENVEDVLKDRLAFQEHLLAEVEAVVAEASRSGQAQVEIRKEKDLEEALEEEAETDALFTRALAVHFAIEQNTLQQEVVELTRALETRENNGIGDQVSQMAQRGQGAGTAISLLSDNGQVPSRVADTPALRLGEENMVEDDAVLTEQEEDAEEDEDSTSGETPDDQDEQVDAENDQDLVEESDEPASPDHEEEGQDVDDSEEVLANEEASWEERCRDALAELCDDYPRIPCDDQLNENCSVLESEAELEQFIERREDVLEKEDKKLEEERKIKEKMMEKEERIRELDEKIERFEQKFKNKGFPFLKDGSFSEKEDEEAQRDRNDDERSSYDDWRREDDADRYEEESSGDDDWRSQFDHQTDDEDDRDGSRASDDDEDDDDGERD